MTIKLEKNATIYYESYEFLNNNRIMAKRKN